MFLLTLALAPVIIIALYIYIRDKYEKEPIGLLLKALGFGILIIIPVFFTELFLDFIKPGSLNVGWTAFYDAFFIAGLTEELFKFLAVFILIWKNKNFNEKFDGIVYATFISLGFAAAENVLYVLQSGAATGYIRAVLSVPAHAIFGVSMGFYLGLAKFYPSQRNVFIFKSLSISILLHGIFDFILMYKDTRLLMLFIPFVIYIYFDAFRKIRNLSSRSIYKE